MTADKVADDYTALIVAIVLESDDDHAVPAQTPPPAVVAVLLGNLARRNQFQVAVRADIVVPVIALWAVKARRCGRDRTPTYVAAGAERNELRIWSVRRIKPGRVHLPNRHQWMSTAASLVDASLAVSPLAVVANITLPSTVIGNVVADITKSALLKSSSWVVRGDVLPIDYTLGGAFWRASIALRAQYVRRFRRCRR